MKTLLFISILFFSGCFTTNAQKKNYFSIGTGLTMASLHNKISDQLIADGIGDRVMYDPFGFLFSFPGQTVDYPETHVQRGNNNRFRYGRQIKSRVAIEGGLGLTYTSHVQGADNDSRNINFLNIRTKISTVYLAYMWNNKKANAAIGIGPAVSVVRIKHAERAFAETLQTKSYILPGLMLTSYWNFINKKSWFMGFRNDLSITSPAKTKELTITNTSDKNFVTVSRSAKVGSVLNNVTLHAGIKF